VTDPRGGRDSLRGSGDGPLFLPGSSCGLGVEKLQVRAAGLMVTAPPFNAVGAGGCRAPGGCGGASASRGGYRAVAELWLHQRRKRPGRG